MDWMRAPQRTFASLHDRTLSFFYGIIAAVGVAASVAVVARVMSPSVPSLSVNLACPHERYLTYGSACMDCGYNNQRIDLEHAIQLAAWSNRTLVVRDIVCSPHSPCPRTTNADPVVYAGWLQSLAKQTLHAAGLLPADGGSSERAAGTGFVAVHARLGDWARHNGCVDCSFKSAQYARALRRLVDQRLGPTRDLVLCCV